MPQAIAQLSTTSHQSLCNIITPGFAPDAHLRAQRLMELMEHILRFQSQQHINQVWVCNARYQPEFMPLLQTLPLPQGSPAHPVHRLRFHISIPLHNMLRERNEGVMKRTSHLLHTGIRTAKILAEGGILMGRKGEKETFHLRHNDVWEPKMKFIFA